MRIDRRFVGWGIFLIALGGVPLLSQQGIIQSDAVRAGPSLWPLIVVGIGLGLLLRDTPLHWAGGLVVAATAGVIAGSVLATGGSFDGFCRGQATGSTVNVAGGELPDGGAIVIDQPCGDLTLRTGDGATWSFDARGSGSAPEVRDEGGTVRISSARDHRFGLMALGERTSWIVAIPRDPTLDLTVTSNAGEAAIDLEGAHLDDLRIEMNAGSALVVAGDVAALRTLRAGLNAGRLGIWLPALSFEGRLEANAGSLALCVPAGTGLRIALDGNLTAADNFADRGLTRAGDVWSRGSTNGATIQLTIEANAGSITLDPEEGC